MTIDEERAAAIGIAAARELAEATEHIASQVAEADFPASGERLDRIAELYGTKREETESEDSLRARLHRIHDEMHKTAREKVIQRWNELHPELVVHDWQRTEKP